MSHPPVASWTFVAADGVEMPLEEGTSAFITMNPGYIGGCFFFRGGLGRLGGWEGFQGCTRWAIVAQSTRLASNRGAALRTHPAPKGRAELPESLKALFRPITVVVPDRQLIMENMLMAEVRRLAGTAAPADSFCACLSLRLL